MRSLTIDGTTISDDSNCYVIAELGNNHQGNMQQARELIQAARYCGVDAVKIQKRNNRTLYTRQMLNAPYENENSFGKTYFEHREALELDTAQIRELQKFSKDHNITLFSTIFDFDSADLCAELEMPAYKIASGDLTNTPLLKHVAQFGKPMIISTGGGTMADVERAYEAIHPINRQICFLQCTAGYPPTYSEMNLRVIETFRERFPDVIVGLSSHLSGIAMELVAYVLGARIVEKHFTLNRANKGTDHAFSLEAQGLRKIVRDLHRARESMGDGVKQRYASEEKPLYKMAKKIVAARDLPAGHVLTRGDLALKSPNDGLPPYRLDEILGRTLTCGIHEDDNILLEHLSGSEG